MNIEITARHFTASDKLKELVNEKIMKIEKFNSGIMNCHVILTKENSGENVEINAHIRGHYFSAHESADIFEKSLANAVEKISIQIKKQHERALGR